MDYVDIGVNLFSEQFKGRRKEIVVNAEKAGVQIIITGSSMKSSESASAYVKEYSNVYATAGIHPHAAKECNEHTIEKLKSLIIDNKNIVAVGECGLDFDRMYSPKNVQIQWFEEQVKLAEELDMPLFLHERDAEAEFLAVLHKHRDICKKAVVHCFTGKKETAMRYLNLGCMIGVTGWVCDERRNRDLVQALKIIPIERLMIETDSPYLTPRNAHGLRRTNVPENIKHVSIRLAELYGRDEETFRKQMYKNTVRFFGLEK